MANNRDVMEEILQTLPPPLKMVVFNDFRNDPNIVSLCRKMAYLERLGYPMTSTKNKHPDQLRLWEQFTSFVRRNYPDLCIKKGPID